MSAITITITSDTGLDAVRQLQQLVAGLALAGAMGKAQQPIQQHAVTEKLSEKSPEPQQSEPVETVEPQTEPSPVETAPEKAESEKPKRVSRRSKVVKPVNAVVSVVNEPVVDDTALKLTPAEVLCGTVKRLHETHGDVVLGAARKILTKYGATKQSQVKPEDIEAVTHAMVDLLNSAGAVIAKYPNIVTDEDMEDLNSELLDLVA